MSASVGTKLGPYEILAPLGAGGMGEVYHARDTRLDRDVALKILNESAAGNADLRARFEREARAVAALNHPNIVSIYDIGAEDGVFYIVSELVEGESLRVRISRGHIPVRELLKIGVQTADGIAAAHMAGFVHRDLKPENIMLTADGRVKILDFGLARQMLVAAVSEHTVTMNQTVPGTILGTVNYMSPEQARGLEAGPQSDQFSFGVILYELATGSRAFQRDTTPQTLTAILVEEPKPIEAKLPVPLRWTIDRCLAKDPKGRYAATQDLYQDLLSQQEHLSELFTAGTEVAAVMPKVRAVGRWVYFAVLAAGLLAGAAVMRFFVPKQRGIGNYRYTPIEISREAPADAAWSPDGKAIAYSAHVDGKRQAFVRYLSSSTPTQITHGAGGVSVEGWSGDGRRIFIAGRRPQSDRALRALFSLSVTGGEPEFVMPLDIAFLLESHSHISRDGKILAVVRLEQDSTISVAISSPIGSPFKRYSPAPFETKENFGNAYLAISPDQSRILYFKYGAGQGRVWDLPLPDGSRAPKQILKDLQIYSTAMCSWFPDSRHIVIALRQRPEEQSHLWLADTVTGSRTPLTTGLFQEDAPSVSPDGKQTLFREITGVYVLVSASLEDASIRNLMASQRVIDGPAWARNSKRFVYITGRDGEPGIWLHDSDGSERPLVTRSTFPGETTESFRNPALSPAEDRVAYRRVAANAAGAIWISSVAGGPPVRLTNSRALEIMGSWSPDGSRMVYEQAIGGIRSLMICKTSGQATPVELRSHLVWGVGTNAPDWSPTGEWIIVEDDGWKLISPDGKSVRDLGKIATPHMTFSKDGQTLYGIHAEGEHEYLFSLSLDGRMRTIGDVGAEFKPKRTVSGARFSVAPDGKSILYATSSSQSSLWMLEGFEQP